MVQISILIVNFFESVIFMIARFQNVIFKKTGIILGTMLKRLQKSRHLYLLKWLENLHSLYLLKWLENSQVY